MLLRRPEHHKPTFRQRTANAMMDFEHRRLRAPSRAADSFDSFDSLQSFSFDELSAHSQMLWTDDSDCEARSRRDSNATMVQYCPAVIQQTSVYEQSVYQLSIVANDIDNDISYQNSIRYGCSPFQSLPEIMDTEPLSTPQDLVRLPDPIMSCDDSMFDEEHRPVMSSLSSSIDMFQHHSADLHAAYSSSHERAKQRSGIGSQLCISPNEIQTAVLEDDRSLHLRERISAARTVTLGKREYTPVQKESKKQTKKRQARQAHSLVERRYRDNLNVQFQALHYTLQKADIVEAATEVLYLHSRNSSQDDESKLDNTDEVDQAPSRLKKSDILIEAMNYIQATEIGQTRRDKKIQELTSRMKMMETLLLNY